MAQTIDLKNKRPREENATPPMPEVLITQSINLEQNREDTSQTKQDAEHVPGFTRDSQRTPVSYEGPQRLANADEIAWHGPLSTHEPNIRNIVITAVIFFSLATLIQIFDGNLITTVFFALLGGVVLIHIGKKPESGKIEINPGTIAINDKKYRYNEIKSFWVEYDLDLGIKELSLRLKRWHSPYIKIPLLEEDPVRIRSYLIEFLPEEEHRDTIADVLARKLGI